MNFGFRKMTGIAVPAVELRVFQELFSMELVNESINQSIDHSIALSVGK
jgi:hypothetical protein